MLTKKCPECNGVGSVQRWVARMKQRKVNKRISKRFPCSTCKGKGKIEKEHRNVEN